MAVVREDEDWEVGKGGGEGSGGKVYFEADVVAQLGSELLLFHTQNFTCSFYHVSIYLASFQNGRKRRPEN